MVFSGTTSCIKYLVLLANSVRNSEVLYKVSYKSVPHTYQRNGIYYFNRRVPNFARQHYKNSRITLSLRTKKRSVAARRAERLAQQLNDYWFEIQMQGVVGSGNPKIFPCCRAIENSNPKPIKSDAFMDVTPAMSDAAANYIRLKGIGKTKKFHQDVRRNVADFVQICGNKNISEYQRMSAHKMWASCNL